MKSNKKSKRKITVSATDIFEYVKCPAFLKHSLHSGKNPDECYHDYYREMVFGKGIDFEKGEIEKLSFAETETSLKDLIKDDNVSKIRIKPPTMLARKMNDILNLPKKIEVIAIGRPDLLVRDAISMKMVPLEYKTSIHHYTPTLYQLRYYCFLLQGYQFNVPNVGFLQTNSMNPTRIDLDQILRDSWEKVVNTVVSLKLGASIRHEDTLKIQKHEINWNRDCRHCYFQQPCKKLILERAELYHLPQIKKKRYEILKGLKINSVEELALSKPDELWKSILKLFNEKNEKNIFQQEWTIKLIISKAKALVEGSVVPVNSEIVKLNFNKGDGFFDLEYDTLKKSPLIFSISLGVVKDEKEINVYNWFVDEPEFSESIIHKFYEHIENNQINRLLGWSINSADLPQLVKIKPLPQNIEFIDIYQHIIRNLALPTLRDGLKDISEYLFGDRYSEVSNLGHGLDAVYYYNRYLKSKDSEYKRMIINYNNQDVLQTYEVAKWFNEFVKAQS